MQSGVPVDPSEMFSDMCVKDEKDLVNMKAAARSLKLREEVTVACLVLKGAIYVECALHSMGFSSLIYKQRIYFEQKIWEAADFR